MYFYCFDHSVRRRAILGKSKLLEVIFYTFSTTLCLSLEMAIIQAKWKILGLGTEGANFEEWVLCSFSHVGPCHT